MKVKLSSIALCAAALAGMSSPGLAGGDWSDQGIADYNRSVPVPAPIPVPVNAAQWYLRGDMGWAAGASGDVTADGFPLDTYSYDSGETNWSFGFAIGYYLNRNWRVEVAGDWSNERTAARHTEGYVDSLITTGPDHPTENMPSVDTINYTGEFDLKSTLHSSAALLNMYYDFETGSWFRPYIGGGLGLSVHRLRVVENIDAACSSVDRDYTPDPIVAPTDQIGMPCGAAVGGAPGNFQSSSGNTVTAYGLAATAMAGAAIELHPGIHWDTGYRFIYRGGTPTITYHTPTGDGTIKVEDRIDHEIRTGLRFDIF